MKILFKVNVDFYFFTEERGLLLFYWRKDLHLELTVE